MIEESLKILDGVSREHRIPELWDGKAAERTVEVIVRSVGVGLKTTEGQRDLDRCLPFPSGCRSWGIRPAKFAKYLSNSDGPLCPDHKRTAHRFERMTTG
jgi:hypothetical protein